MNKILLATLFMSLSVVQALACYDSVNDQDPIDQDTVDPVVVEEPVLDNGR